MYTIRRSMPIIDGVCTIYHAQIFTLNTITQPSKGVSDILFINKFGFDLVSEPFSLYGSLQC